MLGEAVAAASLLIAVTAVLLSLWQNVLQSRALQAQAFLQVIEQSLSLETANGTNLLANLGHYETLEEFEAGEPQNVREAIFRLVDFLNNAASIVEQGLIPQQKIWNVYFWIYRIAYQKLMPWWLDGVRARTYSQRFSAFERMAIRVAMITDEDIKRFDAKRRKMR